MKKIKSKRHAVEITTFRLKSQYSLQDFIDSNLEIDPWLQQQPGFRSRHMGQQNNGTIVDMLIWNSVKEGEAAMRNLMKEFAGAKIHDLIDQRTVHWTITDIIHSI